MIEYITSWLADDNHMIYGLILWLMVAMIIDFVLGFTISKFDKKIEFNSFKAKAGIIVKVSEMILVVYFIPVAVKFGAVGITMYVTMMVGLILSEIYSILGHISDINDNNNWTDYVKKFLDGTLDRKEDTK